MSKRRQSDRNKEKPNSGFHPRPLKPRTEGQHDYIRGIDANTITIVHGPAGTGKTHVAAGFAVQMMKHGQIERIILCRPIVGVGRDIGFLPGLKEEKIGPYLVPLFDELKYYCSLSLLKKWQSEERLIVDPISMLRGRTFNDSFVILDEAQNATAAELRMVTTRVGMNCKLVLAGDPNQSDLKPDLGEFVAVTERLRHTNGVRVIDLGPEDIVRNPLIVDIENALAGL